jgi:hypothetical protein
MGVHGVRAYVVWSSLVIDICFARLRFVALGDVDLLVTETLVEQGLNVIDSPVSVAAENHSPSFDASAVLCSNSVDWYWIRALMLKWKSSLRSRHLITSFRFTLVPRLCVEDGQS